MKNKKNVVVVGGGAAGYFFAINAALKDPHYQIIILEQGRKTLEKVRISGGGRCNVTNGCFDPAELVLHYPRGSKELLGPFNRFSTGDTMAWFEERGVQLKVEDDNRVFPVSNTSSTIIQCFENQVKKLNIEVLKSSKVVDITFADRGLVSCVNGDQYPYDILFLAPGSSRAIWKILRGQGLKIIDPVPSLFTFNIQDNRISGLQGVAFGNVAIHSEIGSYTSEGPLLITHWGLSAPAVLKLSAFEAREMAGRGYKFNITIDFFTAYSHAQIEEIGRSQGGKLLSERNPFGLPKRYWSNLVIQVLNLGNKRWADLNKDEMGKIVGQLKEAKFSVNGKSTFKEEFVTSGGVALQEVDFRDFRIKKFNNVYAAGEVLNIDAVTGGFNFQAAWTGAYLAATAV